MTHAIQNIRSALAGLDRAETIDLGRFAARWISRYVMDKVGDEQKLVINFAGKEKGMICNRTNADRIAHYYGDDLDSWIGKSIILGTELVSC